MTRLFVYLILTGGTWYLSGMYRSFPLTLLFLAEILFLSLLAVQTAIFRAAVSAAFASKIIYAEKNRECRCRIHLRQKSVFPAGRVRLTLVLSYPDGRRKFSRNLYGAVGPRGESDLEFFVRPALCGPVRVELRHWRVYDSLSLFSAARRSRELMTIAVLPRPFSARIRDMTSGGADAGFSGGVNALTRPESSADFRDSREYRPGDPARAINWKQSARTGKLYVREYERESDEFFTLILNRSGHISPENQDAFYEILSAILSGLLERAAGDGGRLPRGEDGDRPDTYRPCDGKDGRPDIQPVFVLQILKRKA